MTTCGELAAKVPELAATGRRLFSQYGPGLGLLATIRPDGGPRLHPVCPVVIGEGRWVFVVPSPKGADPERDSRYGLHTSLPEEVEEEFCVAGRAGGVDDPVVHQEVVAAYHAPVPDDLALHTLGIDRVLPAAYRFRGDWPPVYRRWPDSRKT
jgi:hypothetical protein